MRILEIRRHTMRAKPGQHLSQPGVDLARLVGMRIGPFDRVITSTIPRAFETAIAMGFAVHEQLDQIARIPEDVEVPWPADFGEWERAVRDGGAAARYAQELTELYQTIVRALPEDGSALIINHGGVVEASAIACLPDVSFANWGLHIRPCEGVRLQHDGKRFVSGRVLRVPLAPDA
jgi:broad specificity phosphatase PhoE